MADDFGPGGVYANIPRIDSRGRVQVPMFLRWNPNPIGNEAANLKNINPDLQRVIARARADNPDLHFVLGSGARSAADQDLAKSWGWSPVGSTDKGDAQTHMQGRAFDLWGLDANNRVQFQAAQERAIADAVRAAAKAEGVNLGWGGDFRHPDLPHFELSGAASAPTTATQPGTTINSVPTTVTASTPFSLSPPAAGIPSAGQFQPLIDAAAKKYNLDPNFLARVLWQENRFRPEGTSSAGAQGIAQFIPSTAARYGVDVHNPASSIEGAAHYLSDLSGRYNGNLGLAAAGYNWGEGNVDKWLQGKSRPPSETTNYVNTITGHSMDEWKADPRLPLGTGGPGRSPSGPSGSPTAVAGGPPAAPATGQPAGAGGPSLPGFEAGSPGAKMASEGLKGMGLGGGKPAEPPPMPPPMQLQTQATGGPMMLGPGQQNMMGRTVAQQALAQQGYLMGPQLASAFTGAPPQQPMPLPGTTLNSPSQWQMALQGAPSLYYEYGQGQGQV